MLRKSHDGISKGIVGKDNYIGLPKELEEFNYYYKDGETGHVIMAIPECLLQEIASKGADMDMYEVPMPVKYVLINGYLIINNHIVVKAEYDMDIGLIIDQKYYEV